MNRLFGILFILTGFFALIGGLYTWGDGSIFIQSQLVNILIPWADIILTTPLSIICGYGILKNKYWGKILALNASGIYVFGSVLVFISLFWNKDYSILLIIPALSGLLIGLSYTVFVLKQKMPRTIVIALILVSCTGCNPPSNHEERAETSNDFKEYDFKQSDFTVIQSDSIQWIQLHDKEKIDDYFVSDSELFCGEVNNNRYPLEGIDVASFEVLAGTKYARDKNHLYYPLEMICVCGGKVSNCHCTEYLVSDANPAAFVYLGDDYGRDDSTVYFRGKPIPDTDVTSFELDSFYSAHDKNKQYHFGNPVTNLP